MWSLWGQNKATREGEEHLWPIAWCRIWSVRQKYLGQTIILTSLKSKQSTPQTLLRSSHSSLKRCNDGGEQLTAKPPPQIISNIRSRRSWPNWGRTSKFWRWWWGGGDKWQGHNWVKVRRGEGEESFNPVSPLTQSATPPGTLLQKLYRLWEVLKSIKWTVMEWRACRDVHKCGGKGLWGGVWNPVEYGTEWRYRVEECLTSNKPPPLWQVRFIRPLSLHHQCHYFPPHLNLWFV